MKAVSLRHERVRKARGKASEHPCIDCGNTAQEWAQRHGTDGSEASDYDSRCCSCHQKYDDHWSEETKAKVSKSVKATWVNSPQRRTFSEEHRANMRAGWERRKARTQGGEA